MIQLHKSGLLNFIKKLFGKPNPDFSLQEDNNPKYQSRFCAQLKREAESVESTGNVNQQLSTQKRQIPPYYRQRMKLNYTFNGFTKLIVLAKKLFAERCPYLYSNIGLVIAMSSNRIKLLILDSC